MNDTLVLDAFELLRHAQTVRERLGASAQRLAERGDLERERGWLTQAEQLLSETLEPMNGLLAEVRPLPELRVALEEVSSELQGRWVDALERLHAGITFHVASRSPVLEALFPNIKWAQLRRASREAAGQYGSDFDRRRSSSYVSRMMSEPEFAFSQPVLAELDEARSRWDGWFEGEALAPERADELRATLTRAAARIAPLLAQARLLCEAALLPLSGAYEESGVGARLRRRARPGAAAVTPPAADAAPEPTSAAPDEVVPPSANPAKAAPAAKRKRRAKPSAEVAGG